jgi:hypothetical protein
MKLQGVIAALISVVFIFNQPSIEERRSSEDDANRTIAEELSDVVPNILMQCL